MGDNDDDPGGFRACSEEEIVRSSTGAEVFVDLKGAVDIGFDIPQTEKKFPRYDIESRSVWRSTLDEENYKKQISRDIKLDVTPDSFEGK